MTGPQLLHDNLPLGERLARRWLDDWRGAAALVALLALASSITSITNGFAYDDVPLILDSKRLHDWRSLWRVFGQSYWHGPGAPQDLYRPVTLVGFGIQWAIGGGDPIVFRITSIALYLASAIAVLAVTRLVLPARPAAIGASLWAVHPVHVEAVANVVGQSELITTLAILIAVVTYLRLRVTEGLTRLGVGTIVAAYPIALLSKEHGITLPALLGAVELILWRSGRGWRSGESRVGLLLARLLLYETLIYLVVRWVVLPSSQSVPHFMFFGLSHVERVCAALGLWPEVIRLMLWPARLYADYSPRLVPVHTTVHVVHLISLGILISWGWAFRWAWRAKQGGALLGLLWFPTTFVLVSNLLFPTGILLAERTLFLPSVALAFFVAPVLQLARGRFGVRSGLLVTLLSLLVAAGVWRSANRQRSWTDSITVFTTLVVEAPDNARGLVMLGRLYLRAGAPEKAERYLRRGYELEPSVGAAYVTYLLGLGRCDQALDIIPRVAAGGEANEELETARVACLMERRRFSEARRRSVIALARGFSPTIYRRFLLFADSILAASDSVEPRNQWVREGRPFSRTDQPFKVWLFHEPATIGSGSLLGGRKPPP